jgi:AraC-like DNA-binding protein
MLNGHRGILRHSMPLALRNEQLSDFRNFLEQGYGLHCEKSDEQTGTAEVDVFSVGLARLSDVRISALSLSTRQHVPAEAGHVYVKLVTSGDMKLEQNGDVLTTFPGSLVILDPSTPFVERFENPSRLIVMTCPKAVLRERGHHHHFGHWIIPDIRLPDVVLVRDMISFIAANQNVMRDPTKELLGSQLVDLISVLIDADDQPTMRSPTAALYRVKRYISEHIGDEDLDARSIAAAVGVSVGYLNRLFRNEGTSLMRYLWMQRLQFAREILDSSQSGRLRIEEVAWRCGFSSAAHFSRRFHQHFGRTPSEWRESIRACAAS